VFGEALLEEARDAGLGRAVDVGDQIDRAPLGAVLPHLAEGVTHQRAGGAGGLAGGVAQRGEGRVGGSLP